MVFEQAFPSVAAFERAARSRVPRFAADYLFGGIGAERCLRRNREVLNDIRLCPRHICAADKPELSASLFGRKYDAPFGVAPIGLSGIVWPRAAEYLAAAAKSHNLPFVLSMFATTGLETARLAGGENAWFQLYPTQDPTIEDDIIGRAEARGYEVLVVTVDIPTRTRRERDIASGLAIPPRFNLKTVVQIAAKPRWALRTLNAGVPRFETLKRYLPHGLSLEQEAIFLSNLIEGHVTHEHLTRIRDRWKGMLVVKGVLDVEDARSCVEMGVDGIVVSNHGGRQLDASPHALEVLPEIRAAVGPAFPLIIDGGVRSGLDVARAIAIGADFVLLGRAFVCAAAAGERIGSEHSMAILKEELRHTMVQLGCDRFADLADRVSS